MKRDVSSLRQPAFIAAVLVLGTFALSLNAVVNFVKVHFRKERVELVAPLATIPAELGPWKQVSRDQALSPEIQDALGTDEYIFRRYVDERIVGTETVQQLRDPSLDENEQLRLLTQVYRSTPHAIVDLAVTYYTGLADTVPHIPERCVVADGYEPTPSDNSYPTWPLDGHEPLEVRFINFEDQTGANREPRSIAYVFHVNGRYAASPLAVRATLQNLFERNAYYAKIEVMAMLPDQGLSATVLGDFLGNGLPAVERVLPDWETVQQQTKAD